MRSEKELWGVVLENKTFYKGGLCLTCFYLCKYKIISLDERMILSNVIYKEFSHGYMCDPKFWEPREKWIKARIKKIERQEKFNLTAAGYWFLASIFLLVGYIVLSLIYWIL